MELKNQGENEDEENKTKRKIKPNMIKQEHSIVEREESGNAAQVGNNKFGKWKDAFPLSLFMVNNNKKKPTLPHCQDLLGKEREILQDRERNYNNTRNIQSKILK